MPQKALDENDPPLTTITLRLKNKSFTIFLILINILITLSLVSFDIKDASHVTGTTDSFVIHNWIGALGAQFSYYLFLSIGLAAYPAVILLFICTLRHLFGLTHTANWIYVGGYFLTIFGSAMIFGCYPDFLGDLCQTLNLNQIPGGAFGSTLCHPKFGWLNYVLNTTGCTLLACAMILVGLITIYLYDWRHYSKQLWKEVNDDKIVVKDVDLKKKESTTNQDSQSQLQDTASNVINKVNSVFSWMKVRPGRQLNTIERLGIDDEQDEVYENQTGSETEVIPAIADSRQTFQEIDTETEIEAPQENKPLLLKRQADEEDMPAFVDEDDDMPAFVDEEEFQEEPPLEELHVGNASSVHLSSGNDAEYEDDGEIEPLPDIISDTDVDTPVYKQARSTYKIPTCSVINKVDEKITVDENEINRKREILQETLDSFRIKALTGNATAGPRVTLFEIIPEKGVKVEKIANLNNNIAMELQAEKVRILAPIPGRRSVGIEVPNDESSPVCYRTLLESKEFKNSKATLPIILGKDISGKPIIMDLAKAPHLLIAGATGAGKSVFMNTLILSLLFKFEPDELQMIMVDPKFVELTGYNTIPHLICPVITDPQRVPSALRWAVFEMDCRYQILATVGVKNLEAFNNRTKKPDEPGFDENGNKIPDKLPTTIIIIDELADLMMMAKKDVETSIARIAQKARAVGIHLVIATQRPSVDVVTGIIKANFPTRIAFKVSSNVDSKTILDRKGAEELLGMGDMLFMPPGSSNIIRIQGAWVKDEDIEHVVNHCAKQQDQNFIDIFKNDEEDADQPAQGELFNSDEYSSGDEDLIDKAIEVIRRDRRASTSHIQRRLRIGYNRAATIMEALEERGIVGPQVGSAKREIYLDRIDGDE
ncbi:MAG: DNA translocase FtsK [Lentisphaeraceae bacterium]|nr:DNA translocase FtsK [Lentisphaeraceae bacterium]